MQINPVWLWGPYHVGALDERAQPDWYLGWLIGALRLVPGFDVVVDRRTLIPNPFWGGILLPGIVFGFLFSGRLLNGGSRTTKRRTTFSSVRARTHGAPPSAQRCSSFAFLIFVAGSADRVDVLFGLDYAAQIEVYRVLVLPGTGPRSRRDHRICRELREGERVSALRAEAKRPSPAATSAGASLSYAVRRGQGP